MEVKLREYQRDGIRHLLNNEHACLFYDPGLGKTLTSLLAFKLLQERTGVKRMLIIAPLMVAKTVWQEEMRKWDPLQGMTSTLLWGPSKDVLFADCKNTDVTIINYEGLPWLMRTMRGRAWPWDVLVFDELSKCKDTSTRRHKLLKQVIHHFPRRWGLTGTPAPNSLLELFGQMLVVDGGKSLGTTMYKYRQKYFTQPYPGSYDWDLREGAAQQIADLVAPICHRLSKEENLKDLPPKIDTWHNVRLPPSALETYKDFEEDQIIQLGSGSEITAMTAGVVWGKLQQLAQGFMYGWQEIDGEQERFVEEFHSAKIPVLENIIEEAQGTPVLVFYKYNHELDMLLRNFSDATIMDGKQLTVNRWNAKEIPILLCQPQSAAHGLNLQAGGHIMVWYCIESSNERYIQGCGRLHRSGQQYPVACHHLMAKGTVDEGSRDVLEGRATQQAWLLKKIAKRAVV